MSVRPSRLAFALASLSFVFACKPDLGEPQTLVRSRRVLAVRGTPPEAKPGESVSYDLLVASPEGTVVEPSAQWDFCNALKPPADNNVVTYKCLGDDVVTGIGGPSKTATANTPKDACFNFGPEIPSPKPGEQPQRPRDPDVTGGYYQPVRVKVEGTSGSDDAAFGLERIRCNLANAPVDVVADFGKRYQANQNPQLQTVRAVAGAGPVDVFRLGESGASLSVKAGHEVTFRAQWSAESPESFPVFDVQAFNLSDVRESLRVSWFSTEGEFERERTGRSGEESELFTENTWMAPTQRGLVHLWVVLRDSRGGVDFAAFDVNVTE
jgi:hypothetical protein